MNFLILFFILSCNEVFCDFIMPVQVVDSTDLYERPPPGHGGISQTVHKSKIMYQCFVKEFNESVLVIYGTKSWRFPAQDVNLTLSYPTGFMKNSNEPSDEYIITGFKVHLYVDATNSKGYINDGGIWQDMISLSFTLADVTTLAYHFWIYGVPKQMANAIDYLSGNSFNNTMC
ncbi:hypothetical protein K1T71_012676 [Dendrolimus kikuchii]|uniref:Uncharacterized protein n=1 Tax=Dendrolimus kikuchii TaxID=765133 RepID=A0ACC1CK30_9NEOP|nr:hypothetical protein K1T71_012676 [Dendrolimus kikuchii]